MYKHKQYLHQLQTDIRDQKKAEADGEKRATEKRKQVRLARLGARQRPAVSCARDRWLNRAHCQQHISGSVNRALDWFGG